MFIYFFIQGLSLPAPGENSLQARIRASSSALQLDRALILVKEGKLQGLIQQHLDEEGTPLPTSIPLSARSLAVSDQPFSHANLVAARRQHLQVSLKHPKQACTELSAFSA